MTVTSEPETTMRTVVGELHIAQGKCMGHGRCYGVAPDLLSDDDEGFVAQAGQVLDIGEDQLAQARDAAEACPERAIEFRSR